MKKFFGKVKEVALKVIKAIKAWLIKNFDAEIKAVIAKAKEAVAKDIADLELLAKNAIGKELSDIKAKLAAKHEEVRQKVEKAVSEKIK